MPSITLQGFETDNNTQINGDNAFVGTSTLTLTISEGASLIYSIIPNSETIGNGQILEADIVPINGAGDVYINGMATSVDLTWVYEASFSNGSSATILTLQNSATGQEYFFPIDGNLTIPTSQAEWEALNNSFTGASYATGTYAPNTAFDPLTFPNGTVTVDDYWVGYDDPELFNGGAGDDDLSGQGGNDTITGGAGDDYIRGGAGDDSLDGGDDYDQVVYDDATSGVTVNLVTGTATGGAGNDTIANFEMVRGSMHDDHITGDSGSNQVRGLDGNDTLIGGDGNDRVRYDRDANYGGAAGVNVNLMTGIAIDGFGDTDSLSGFERVMGSNSGDTIIGDNGDNDLQGMDGNDSISGNGGYDYIVGGLGDDTIDGGADNDEASYEEAASAVNVNLATGTATGGDGNDVLTNVEDIRGSDFNDTLTGDANDNQMRGLDGNDTLIGGDGWDSARYDRDADYGGGAGVNVNLMTGVAIDGFGDTDSLSGFERVVGTNSADTIIGDNGDNDLQGLDGNDSISGNGGYDYIVGGLGDDTIDGGADNDEVVYDEASSAVNVNLETGTASGGDGNDVLSNIENIRGSMHSDTLSGDAGRNYIRGLAGDDTITGGAERDHVSYDRDARYGGTAGVNVNLMTGVAIDGFGDTDSLIGIEEVTGTDSADTLTGDGADNFIDGRGGNDSITGNDGNDDLRGGSGDDTILGGLGNDRLTDGTGSDFLDGGDGIDTFYRDLDQDFAAYSWVAVVDLSAGRFYAQSLPADYDTITNIENVDLDGQFHMHLIGNAENNDLRSDEGNDTLVGGGGRDNMSGGDGDDTLDASGGDSASQGYGDIIQGGTGNNTIIGHAQAFADRSGGGIDVIYENVAGTGGVVITVGANGTGTTTSNNAGVVNDTFTYADHFEGTQDADVFNGSNGGSGTGQGNESWVGEAGNDTINGNGGWDTVQYWLEGGTNGVNVNLATGVATDSYGDTDSLSGIEGVAGTDQNDTLIGDGNDNYFEDRGGDDSINAAGGNDWIRLNSGSDTVDGGDGFDTLEIDLNGFTLPAGFIYQLDLSTGYSGQLGNPNLSDSISNVEALMLRGSYDAQVTGDAEDNRFETGTGNDTLTGGAGEDSFIYNGGADVITDFNGDLIGISSSIWTGTDAQLIADATVVSGNLVLDFGGGNTLTLNGITDASVLQGRILGAATPDVTSDVTGDGTSDILWRNGTTGQYGMFDMAGGTPTWSVLGGESTAWQIGGLGDFDGDGTDDILWRNDTSGGIGFSAMGTGSPVWNALGTASAAWQIMGVGDFNGDGTDDILWQNSSNGGVGMFAMSGGTATWQTIGGSSAPWEIVATGDITGDGIDDIIWRNSTTGQVGQFEMSGAGTPTWSVVANVSNDWRLVGTGDLDGDGTDDLLWRHESSGAVGYYAMGSGSPVWQGLGQASFDWDIVGTGDYNGDGTDDILWRNVNTGTVGMYDMDGGPSWQTIGQAALAWDVEGQFVDEFVF